MSKAYDRMIAALDTLTAPELAALLGVISTRLQAQLGPAEPEPADESGDPARRYLPRLAQMIAWGVVVPMEDTLYVRGIPDQPALLLDANRVAYQGVTMSLNDWAKTVTGWKAVNVYEWSVVKRTGRTLDEMRRAYMADNGIE